MQNVLSNMLKQVLLKIDFMAFLLMKYKSLIQDGIKLFICYLKIRILIIISSLFVVI